MSLSNLFLAVFLILIAISQYFMKWVVFGEFGLIIIGVIGFAAGVLILLAGLKVYDYTINR